MADALWALLQPELSQDVPEGWLTLVRQHVETLRADLERARSERSTEALLAEDLARRVIAIDKALDAIDPRRISRLDRIDALGNEIRTLREAGARQLEQLQHEGRQRRAAQDRADLSASLAKRQAAEIETLRASLSRSGVEALRHERDELKQELLDLRELTEERAAALFRRETKVRALKDELAEIHEALRLAQEGNEQRDKIMADGVATFAEMKRELVELQGELALRRKHPESPGFPSAT